MKKVNSIKVVSFMVITIVLFMGVGTLAHAFGRGHGCGEFCGFGPGALKCLDLTAGQKKQIAGIFKKYQTRINQSMEEIRKLREQALESGAYDKFNEEQVRSKFREAVPKFEDMFVLKARIRNEIRATLTEDQIRQLKEKRAKWIEKSKDHKKFGKAMMKNWLEMDEE
jgi:Spy/CpxP family protein refolding chaperone